MFVPLVVIFAFIIWAAMAWIKWFIIRRNNRKYQMDPKLLAEMLKGSGVKNSEELLKKFRERQKAEEDAKIESTQGKDLFEQMEERLNVNQSKKPRVFDPDMFHDTVSRMHAEQIKKEQIAKDNKSQLENKTGNGSAKIRSSKLKPSVK